MPVDFCVDDLAGRSPPLFPRSPKMGFEHAAIVKDQFAASCYAAINFRSNWRLLDWCLWFLWSGNDLGSIK